MRGKEQAALDRLNGLKAEILAQKRQESLLEDALRQWESQCKFLEGQFGRLAAEAEEPSRSAQGNT